MDALRAEAGIRTPRVVPARRRRARRHHRRTRSGGPERHCVMFEFLARRRAPRAGRRELCRARRAHREDAPARSAVGPPERLPPVPLALRGRLRWPRPAGDAGSGASGSGAEEQAVLGRLDETLRRRLEAFGRGPERYGLVHADTRLANLLVEDGSVSVIDFDDCGFSWYLYDLGTTVSFFEHQPQVPELIDSWLNGYRRLGDARRRGRGGDLDASSSSAGSCSSPGSARTQRSILLASSARATPSTAAISPSAT